MCVIGLAAWIFYCDMRHGGVVKLHKKSHRIGAFLRSTFCVPMPAACVAKVCTRRVRYHERIFAAVCFLYCIALYMPVGAARRCILVYRSCKPQRRVRSTLRTRFELASLRARARFRTQFGGASCACLSRWFAAFSSVENARPQARNTPLVASTQPKFVPVFASKCRSIDPLLRLCTPLVRVRFRGRVLARSNLFCCDCVRLLCLDFGGVGGLCLGFIESTCKASASI
jgi:hypothetical protein